jgi:hypothetical protein
VIPLLFSNLFSVDVGNLPREERLLFECKAEARDLTPAQTVESWAACDEKAVERGLDSVRPIIQGYALEAELLRDYAPWVEEDPVAWAKVVLGSAANRDVRLPAERVRSAWLALLKDRDEADKLSHVSSVTVRWKASLEGKGEQDELDAQVRRHLLDLGWSVPEPDSWDAGESSIIIMAYPSVEHTVWDKNDQLKITRVSITAGDVRFKGLEAKGKPIDIKEEHQDNDRDRARRSAFEAAGQSFAQALLDDVVRRVFKGYEVPAPPS